jgi:hypothetical protein
MNKFTFLLSFTLFFLIISCNEKKSKKILDINEIYKPVENKPKEELKTVIIDTMRPIFDLYNQKFVDLNLTKIIADTEAQFIARFPHKKMTNLLLKSPTAKIKHTEIHYADSLDMKNAFFNYLDCFGDDCRNISVNEKVNFKKDFFMLINTEKSIHIIESNKNQNPNNWIYLINSNSKSIKTLIIQNKNQVANWYTYQNNLLIEVK